jgi:hypothetical protein
MQLKNLFREHPGKSTIEIQFMSGQKKLGSLSIDSQWGVKSDHIFEEKLRNFLEIF